MVFISFARLQVAVVFRRAIFKEIQTYVVLAIPHVPSCEYRK